MIRAEQDNLDKKGKKRKPRCKKRGRGRKARKASFKTHGLSFFALGVAIGSVLCMAGVLITAKHPESTLQTAAPSAVSKEKHPAIPRKKPSVKTAPSKSAAPDTSPPASSSAAPSAPSTALAPDTAPPSQLSAAPSVSPAATANTSAPSTSPLAALPVSPALSSSTVQSAASGGYRVPLQSGSVSRGYSPTAVQSDANNTAPSINAPSSSLNAPPESGLPSVAMNASPSSSVTAANTSIENLNAIDFPRSKNSARLALVLDDAGGNLSSLKHCLLLPFPITVAILPGLSYSRQCADAARAHGAEVLLHQPMQAKNLDIKPGPLAITSGMTGEESLRLVADNIASIGGAAGVNNHEGSLITEDMATMVQVIKAAQDAGAYFLDSRTTSGTKVGDASAVIGSPYYERDVFLDNSHDKNAIIEQVRRALEIANRDGAAIMIGHVRTDDALFTTLKEIAPKLQAAGYVFCTVSQSGALRGQ